MTTILNPDHRNKPIHEPTYNEIKYLELKPTKELKEHFLSMEQKLAHHDHARIHIFVPQNQEACQEEE